MKTQVVLATTGPWRLSKHGREYVASSMYAKGKAFIASALLLKRNGGSQFVVLHLFCQGVEILLKSLLLLIDYGKFNLKLKSLGHDLVKVTDALIAELKLNKLKQEVAGELKALSDLYSNHLLRYGSGFDIFVQPNTIPYRRVLRKVCAVVKMVERKSCFHAAISI